MEFAQQLDAAEHGWTAPVAHTVAGISYRQLDYWTRTRLLEPSIAEADGCGSKRRYSTTDVVALVVLARLRTAGVDLPVAAKYADLSRDDVLATVEVDIAGGMRLVIDLTSIRRDVYDRLLEILDGPALSRRYNTTGEARYNVAAVPVPVA